jgi:endonuclease/exonuclease/phosphatase family metal-dependent hydrolase
VQYAQIAYGDKKLNVFNLHLDVFSRNNRRFQIQKLIEWVKQDARDTHLVFGGDFNYQAELGRDQKADFKGYDPNDEKLPPFFQNVWTDLPGIQEAFMQADSSREQIHQHITFPELEKRHDFMFFSSEFEHISSTVIDTISSSDHLPVHVVVRMGD